MVHPVLSSFTLRTRRNKVDFCVNVEICLPATLETGSWSHAELGLSKDTLEVWALKECRGLLTLLCKLTTVHAVSHYQQYTQWRKSQLCFTVHQLCACISNPDTKRKTFKRLLSLNQFKINNAMIQRNWDRQVLVNANDWTSREAVTVFRALGSVVLIEWLRPHWVAAIARLRSISRIPATCVLRALRVPLHTAISGGGLATLLW